MRNVIVRAEPSMKYEAEDVWKQWSAEFKDYHPKWTNGILSFRTTYTDAKAGEEVNRLSLDLTLRPELAWVSIDVVEVGEDP